MRLTVWFSTDCATFRFATRNGLSRAAKRPVSCCEMAYIAARNGSGGKRAPAGRFLIAYLQLTLRRPAAGGSLRTLFCRGGAGWRKSNVRNLRNMCARWRERPKTKKQEENEAVFFLLRVVAFDNEFLRECYLCSLCDADPVYVEESRRSLARRFLGHEAELGADPLALAHLGARAGAGEVLPVGAVGERERGVGSHG